MSAWRKHKLQGNTLKLIISAIMGAIFLSNTGAVCAADLVINEVYANPVNEDEEFIELYNLANEDVELNGYQLADLKKTYTVPEATISAKGFFSFRKTTTAIALNNSGEETVYLKDKEGNLVDSFTYEGTVEEKSYSRFPDGSNSWLAETKPTENTTNQAPPSPSPVPEPSPSPVSSSPSPGAVASPSPSPLNLVSPNLLTVDSEPESEIVIELLPAATESGEILGASNSSQSSQTKNPYMLSIFLIFLGLGLIMGVGVVYFKNTKVASDGPD